MILVSISSYSGPRFLFDLVCEFSLDLNDCTARAKMRK